jgi:hypothetical protein
MIRLDKPIISFGIVQDQWFVRRFDMGGVRLPRFLR